LTHIAYKEQTITSFFDDWFTKNIAEFAESLQWQEFRDEVLWQEGINSVINEYTYAARRVYN